MAREIADDINRERAGRGLPKIPVDVAYSAGAQRVAESNRDRPCHACHSTDHPSGEVVWWGSDYPSSGSPIWWMGSPPHRALLLAPNATKLGVGVACNGTEHDAVAWIETQTEAENASPTPVVTKSTAGSRCAGGTASPATTPSTRTTVPGGGAAAGSTSSTAARGTTTTSAQTQRGAPAATTTTARQQSAVAADLGDDTPSAAGPLAAADPRIAASSRPLARSRDVGAMGTMLLLMTFVGALLVGRTARRGR